MTRVRANAKKLFETFHDKPAGTPVYPFEGSDEGEKVFDARLAPMCCAGHAVRVMYRSDKWEEPGVTHDYYHDHDRGKVKLWLPAKRGQKAEKFPYEWPEAVTHLGECINWFYQPDGAGVDGIIEVEPKGHILVSAPCGFIDPLYPENVFLAIIREKDGHIAALLEGSTLRLTSHGIEG